MSKRIWIALASVAAGLIGAAALLVDAEQFRPALEAQLRKGLARPVALGRLSHSLIPLSLRAEAIQIGEDARFGGGTFATAKQLTVRVALWPLLSRKVEIQSVELVEPEAELIRRDGVWNYDSLGGKKDNASSPVELGRADIVNGQVAVTLDGAPRVVYPRATVHVTGISPGQANIQLTAAGSVADVSGQLTGEAWMRGGAIQGKLALRDGHVRKAAFGNVNATFDLTENDIRSLEVSLGQLIFRASGSIRDGQLALKLQAPSAPIGELVRLAAAFGQGLPAGLDVKGQFQANLELQGTSKEPRITGRIEAADLRLAGGDFKQPVRTSAIAIELQPDTIRSLPFEIECGPTKLSAQFSVRGYATARPLLESALFTENSELADLVQIAQAYGVAAAGMRGSGKATLRVRAHGPLAKGSPLQFTGKGSLEGATIQMPSLTEALQIDRAQIAFAQDSASVDGLRVKVAGSTVDGRAEVSNFAAPRIKFALTADRVDSEKLSKLAKPATGATKPARYSADGTLAIGSLEFNQLRLAAVRATADFRDGVLRLEPLTANLYGGSTSGAATLDTRGANTAMTIDTKLEKIESGQLLAAISGLPQIVTGPLSATVKLSLAPRPNEEPLRSMAGNVTLLFTGGKLHTLNLLGELNGVARFLYGPKAEDKFTSFLRLQGELALDKGSARTQGLKLDLEDATATFIGGMNFVDQTLNMKLVSVLNRKLAEKVGGNKIGGWMTAAVQNAGGELIIPTLMTGTFSKPRLTPDAPAIAKLKLQNTVPALTQDPRAVIDAVKGGKEGLKDVLDIFRGGAKKK